MQTCGDGETIQAVVYTGCRSLGLRRRGLVDLEDEEEEAVSVILPEKGIVMSMPQSKCLLLFHDAQMLQQQSLSRLHN